MGEDHTKENMDTIKPAVGGHYRTRGGFSARITEELPESCFPFRGEAHIGGQWTGDLSWTADGHFFVTVNAPLDLVAKQDVFL